MYGDKPYAQKIRESIMRNVFLLMVGLAVILSSHANAGISLSATRVIFGGEHKEASINVKNNGDREILIQSWIEPDKSSITPPFAITPPLAKMKGNQRQLLRIFYQGDILPKNKESVFWLSVQEIPLAAEGDNVLQLALMQRIKLFYRPSGLPGDANSAPESLKVKVNNGLIELYNPTPYHINMISLKQGSIKYDGEMIPPSEKLTINAPQVKEYGSLEIAVVNDYGATAMFDVKLEKGLSSAVVHMKG